MALLMLMTPLAAAGNAHPSSSRIFVIPNSSQSVSGCGVLSVGKVSLKPTTGVGLWSGSAKAAPCKSSVNGVGSSSDASGSGGVEAIIPVKLSSSNTGVNVTWSLQVSWALKVVLSGSSKCSVTSKYNYSYYYTYLSSWVNTTDTYSYCSSSGSVDLSASAYLVDMTTGYYYYPSNYWNGLSKYFDRYNDTSTSVTNYSNPNYWSSNYTSWSNYGSQSGTTGSGTITAGSSPTFFINGTFTTGDRYFIVTTIGNSVDASISSMKGATVQASLTGSGASNFEDVKYAVH
ncbi:MAG TPA: hypothetical protein VMH90_06450 [Thermoplasmata archaeon]|nr:hypothetical protein [Thermoplasmata archaeon]